MGMVLLALFGTLVVVTGLAVGLGTWQVAEVAEGVDRIDEAIPAEEGRPHTASAAQQALTFLVVGVDPADEETRATRAEAALLVRLTSNREHVQVVSVPVDTWVGGSSSTLEGAFSSGGPQGMVQAVETLTDVRIDHYAELDYSGLATITDALGSITVDVPEAYSNRSHDFAPGPQQMDGAKAVAFVRDAGPETRAAAPVRQQRVLQALFSSIQAQGALLDPGRLTNLLDSMTGALRVDAPLANEDLIATAWEFRSAGTPEFVSAPVSGSGVEGDQPVRYLDDGRAGMLWDYLRDDTLAGHLGEFR
jgi:LCP family protein required for cell wall assembly